MAAMKNLAKSTKALEQLERDGRMTDHEWSILDQQVQRAILDTTASILRKKQKPGQ